MSSGSTALIYQVDLDVDAAIAAEYGAWLRAHVDRMLRIDGFDRAVLYDREVLPGEGEDGKIRWTVQYHVRSRAALDHYFAHDAAKMRGDGLDRFGGRFTATRAILEPDRSVGEDHTDLGRAS